MITKIIEGKKFIGAEGQSELFELLDGLEDGTRVEWTGCRFEDLILNDNNCPQGTARGDFLRWAQMEVESNKFLGVDLSKPVGEQLTFHRHE